MYLAFDLEIYEDVDEAVDWKTQMPLGITCISTVTNDGIMKTWYPKGPSYEPIDRAMNKGEVDDLVIYMMHMVDLGYEIISWNGLSFDFAVLHGACNPEYKENCKLLALNHIDMMFHFFCVKGYWVGLQAVALGLGLSGKSEGMSGALAPRLWKKSPLDRLKVLNYVDKDSITTMEIFLATEEAKTFSWTARSGRINHFDFPEGWRNVQHACKIPTPDNSWMSEPHSRKEMLWWLP